MKNRKIPAKLLRALRVFACMKSETVQVETGFVYHRCQEAIKTAQEYALSERMEADDEP